MYYKLTDENMQTYDGFQWKLGKWYEIPKESQGGMLCSKSWFHCYNHPLLAVLINPIHANFNNPKLFEIKVDGDCKEDKSLKFGFTKMKLVKEIELPEITIEQKVRFAIYCALEVYDDEDFVRWAQNWLNGKDKTAAEAAEATEAAWAARTARVARVAAEAARAARVAAEAARAAGWAAARAAEAAWATRAAEAAARAAAWAAAGAAEEIDLIAIAELACEEK